MVEDGNTNAAPPPPAQENPAESAKATDPADQDRAARLEAELKEHEKKYLYLYSEFENFKKRATKERSDVLKFGWEPLARELLQIIDHLEMALEHAKPETDKALKEDIQIILKQFHDTLEKRGITPILTNEKVSFDPTVHEAVGQVASAEPKGAIVKEQAKGYTLHGRLLRPARVVVSQGTEPGSEEKKT